MHQSGRTIRIPKYLLMSLKQHKNTSKTMRQVTKYFHCFMRKQNTKIHTDFELSICRLHPSVFISLYNMQHWRYILQPPRLRCDLIIAPSASVAYLAQSLLLFLSCLLSSQTSSVLCILTQNKHLDNWHIIIMINNGKNDKSTGTVL